MLDHGNLVGIVTSGDFLKVLASRKSARDILGKWIIENEPGPRADLFSEGLACGVYCAAFSLDISVLKRLDSAASRDFRKWFKYLLDDGLLPTSS